MSMLAQDSSSFVTCILSIIEACFTCGVDFTIINVNNDYNDVIRSISADSCHSFIIRKNIYLDNYVYNQAYLITAQDVENLNNDIENLSFEIYWNARAQFVVMMKSVNNDTLNDIFNVFLKYKVLNVILITKTAEDTTVYTYFPYNDGACGRNFSSVVAIDDCTHIKTIDYFPNKLPSKLKDCTINIVLHEDLPHVLFGSNRHTKKGAIGLEQYMFDIIATVEEFTLNYITAKDKENYGVVLSNHSSTGLLQYIQEGEADIAIGGIMLIKNRANSFDYIWGHNYDGYRIYVPRVVQLKWKMVFKEFSLATWLLILATFVIFIFITLVMMMVITKNYFKRYDHMKAILILWGYLFVNTSSPLGNDKKYRLILGNWIWFTFFVNSFYSTSLYSLTTGRHFELPLEDLEQVLEAGYKPCVSSGPRTYLLYTYNQTLAGQDPRPACDGLDSSLIAAASGEKLFTIASLYIDKQHLFIDDEGQEALNSIDYFWSALIVPYTYHGFPFLKKFQRHARHIFEAGLLIQHFNNIQVKNGVKPVLKTKKFRQIYLSDLRIAFMILFAGYVLAFVIFVIEKTALKLQREI